MLNVMLIFYFSVCLEAGFGQILLWPIFAFAARKLKKKNTGLVHLVLGPKHNFEWWQGKYIPGITSCIKLMEGWYYLKSLLPTRLME
jgi:hypothetical protein